MFLAGSVGITDSHGRENAIQREMYLCFLGRANSSGIFVLHFPGHFFISILIFMVKIRMNMPFQALRTQMPSFSVGVYVYALSIQDWPMDSQQKEKNSQKLNWSMCNQVASFKDQKATRSKNIPSSLSIEELSFLKYRHNLLSCVSFHCTSQILSFFQVENSWQLCIGQAYQHHVSNSIYSFCVSVSHFGNYYTISNFFPYYGITVVFCDQ